MKITSHPFPENALLTRYQPSVFTDLAFQSLYSDPKVILLLLTHPYTHAGPRAVSKVDVLQPLLAVNTNAPEKKSPEVLQQAVLWWSDIAWEDLNPIFLVRCFCRPRNMKFITEVVVIMASIKYCYPLDTRPSPF